VAQARIAAAKDDLERIASAQERVVVDIGYMVRLFALDDSKIADNVGFAVPNDVNDVIDGLEDENLNAYYQNVPGNLFINTEDQDFVANGQLLLDRLTQQTEFNTIIPMAVWNGPYIAWRNDLNVPGVALGPTDTAYDDIGNDPWGNNYILFTARGLINEPEGAFVTTSISALDTQAVDGGGGTAYPVRGYDRPTVLSLGPDGEAGELGNRVYGAGDDLVRPM
jgi:hypothetical protein